MYQGKKIIIDTILILNDTCELENSGRLVKTSAPKINYNASSIPFNLWEATPIIRLIIRIMPPLMLGKSLKLKNNSILDSIKWKLAAKY